MTDQELNEAVAKKLGIDYCADVECSAETCPCEEKLKDYCNSISAAWEVVEKIPHFTLYYADLFNARWKCSWLGKETVEWVAADTAPRAICEAFLKLP